MKQKTPESMRIHIGFFGLRNVGKSSLLNALADQPISIVSDTPGTTTDPVKKAMELIPLGPVLFIDTAGLDDIGDLGGARVKRSEAILQRVDAAVVVLTAQGPGPFEKDLLERLKREKVPTIVAVNRSDEATMSAQDVESFGLDSFPTIHTSALTGEGVVDLKNALISAIPERLTQERPILHDLLKAGEVLVLVTPIDAEAPKGRVIMPQVQALRDALDHDIMTMVVKETELKACLESLRKPPALVVTDSQAFEEVSSIVPDDVPLTSFSIIFARYKGDIHRFAAGAQKLSELKPDSRILMAEACSHNPVEGDIGREKLPRWLREKIGPQLQFDFVKGVEFYDAEKLKPYDLVIHCGGCTLNRRGLLSRLDQAEDTGVAMTNYGLTIAWCHGILERAIAPFPELS